MILNELRYGSDRLILEIRRTHGDSHGEIIQFLNIGFDPASVKMQKYHQGRIKIFAVDLLEGNI